MLAAALACAAPAGSPGGSAPALRPAQAVQPRLVVLVTVDQLRPDYLVRWRDQLTSGFAYLRQRGAYFPNAFQDHAVTETAPGHATLLSGRWPAHTGIAHNAAGVQDPDAPLLGVAGPGASPHRFRGTTLVDWLEAVDSGTQALSVSRKDRGAILPIGRSRQHVYWYQSGVFTTSAYYRDSLPAWVLAFNARRVPFGSAGRAWMPLLPADAYPEPDSAAWESGGIDVAFPHMLPLDSAWAAAAYAGTPWLDSLALGFALEGATVLRLGRGDHVDLLAVSLSSADAVGHRFGPDSRELHDMIVRLDRYLGWFFAELERRYGRRGFIVALTADHGVTPFPAHSRAHGHPEAVGIVLDTLLGDVNQALGVRVGAPAGEPRWLSEESGMILLEGREQLAAAGVPLDSLAQAVAQRIARVAGVARVDRPAALAGADTATDAVARRWLHQLPSDHTVLLVATPDAWSVWGNAPYAMHGRPHDLDAGVPLFLAGPGVRAGEYTARAATVDIAPTLARVLGVSPAERVDGRVLAEALEP